MLTPQTASQLYQKCEYKGRTAQGFTIEYTLDAINYQQLSDYLNERAKKFQTSNGDPGKATLVSGGVTAGKSILRVTFGVTHGAFLTTTQSRFAAELAAAGAMSDNVRDQIISENRAAERSAPGRFF